MTTDAEAEEAVYVAYPPPAIVVSGADVDVAPGARHLTYADPSAGSYSRYLVQLDRSLDSLALSTGHVDYPAPPAWAPDGTWMVFEDEVGSWRRVDMGNLSASDMVIDEDVHPMAFSPDGSGALFAGTDGLWWLPRTSRPSKIDDANHARAAFAPDGKLVAIATTGSPAGVDLLTLSFAAIEGQAMGALRPLTHVACDAPMAWGRAVAR